MKKFIIVFVVIWFALFLSGCNPFLPIYERVSDLEDEDGISIIIDGVVYKMLPRLKWSVGRTGDMIGYAGSWGTTVFSVEGDPERNFVFLLDFWSDAYYSPLYRTDIDIPEPSADTINKIIYIEDYYGGEDSIRYSNTVTDKEIIRELFDLLENGERVNKEHRFIKDYQISIACFTDELPNSSYTLLFYSGNGELLCGGDFEEFVVMPVELLSKIAGHEIKLEDLIP